MNVLELRKRLGLSRLDVAKASGVSEWLLFLALPVSALLLVIEFELRFLRVKGVVRDTYDITDRASI